MGPAATLKTLEDAAPPSVLERWGGGSMLSFLMRLKRRRQPAEGAPPRFRQSDRDAKSDAARMDAIRVQIRKALASVDNERTGLERRLVEVNTRAASLLGTEDGTRFEREDADEKLLVRTETQMMNAARRLTALRAQQTRLLHLLEVLD
jgi:hypothetical protein